MPAGPVLTRTAASATRKLSVALVSVALLRPGIVVAAPAGQPSVSKLELEAFNTASREGLARFDRGDHLGAAGLWLQGVKLLPEIAEYRESRANTYVEIARAFRMVLDAGAGASVLEAALAELDAYAASFETIYPGEPVAAEVTTVREALRARLAGMKADRSPGAVAQPADTRPHLAGTRPDRSPGAVAQPADTRLKPRPAAVEPWRWRGLAIGGGVATGGGLAMFGMFIGGYVRAKSLEREFDGSCYLSEKSEGVCGELYDRGQRANGAATAGLLLAPLLVGVGVTMLVLGVRRKASAQVLAPTVGPSILGWVWQRRF